MQYDNVLSGLFPGIYICVENVACCTLLMSPYPEPLEMRQKFDSGEDPLDPESQQGGGQGGQGWPFHFNPFESGGNYHFKFNH